MILDARKRANIKIGIFVEIVLKANQRTGELSQGVVAKILTKSVSHPYGIKVQLESGLIGRVKNII
ncbi:YwbE family protein [uncultured Polaribacter sp.]|uniref:YwbE family protein n=1 Tax=uncultured Polaribacter sp. TaxID=174711 RepID=UPI0030D8E1DF|tara:strand:- start:295 stop:492 length:198 start_codon:yes stop_codon:yes gene_type:complete